MKEFKHDDIISEINITPFVDVVLVLLIIFMVTAPILVKQMIDVKLPHAKSGKEDISPVITIVINKK
ncbi:MAG: ExbD/TolR family protein, partial [Nitrospinota bacterium]